MSAYASVTGALLTGPLLAERLAGGRLLADRLLADRLLAGARLPVFLLVAVALGVLIVCLAIRSARRPSRPVPPITRPRLLDDDEDVSHIHRYEARRDGRELP